MYLPQGIGYRGAQNLGGVTSLAKVEEATWITEFTYRL
jgi:hypothetical protein